VKSKIDVVIPRGSSNRCANFQVKRSGSWSGLGLSSSRRTAAQHVGSGLIYFVLVYL